MTAARIPAPSESKVEAKKSGNVKYPNPFVIFEEYYQQYLISRLMLQQSEFSKFPPGLVPLMCSYCLPSLPSEMLPKDQVRLDNYMTLRRQVSHPVSRVESNRAMMDDLSIEFRFNALHLTGENIDRLCEVKLYKNGEMSWQWAPSYIQFNHLYNGIKCHDSLLIGIKKLLGLGPLTVTSLFDNDYINDLKEANKMMVFIVAAAYSGHASSILFLSNYYSTFNDLGLFSDTRLRYPTFNYSSINACRQANVMANTIESRFERLYPPRIDLIDFGISHLVNDAMDAFCKNLPTLRFGFFKLCRQIPIPQSRTINDLLEMPDESAKLFARRVQTSPELYKIVKEQIVPYLPANEKDHPNIKALLKALDSHVPAAEVESKVSSQRRPAYF